MAIDIDQAFNIDMEVKQRIEVRIIHGKLVNILTPTSAVGGKERETFSLDFGNAFAGLDQLGDIMGVQRGRYVRSPCRVDGLTESMSEKILFVGDESAV